MPLKKDLHFDILTFVHGGKIPLPTHPARRIRRHRQRDAISVDQRVCNRGQDMLDRVFYVWTLKPEHAALHPYGPTICGAKIRGSWEKEKRMLQLDVILIAPSHLITYCTAEKIRSRYKLRGSRPVITIGFCRRSLLLRILANLRKARQWNVQIIRPTNFFRRLRVPFIQFAPICTDCVRILKGKPCVRPNLS